MRVDHPLAQRLFVHGVESARRSLGAIADDAFLRTAVAESLRAAVADSSVGTGNDEDVEPRFEVPRLVRWDGDRAMIVLPTAEADSRPLAHALVLHRTDDPRDVDELAAMLAAASDELRPLGVDRMACFVHGPLPQPGTSPFAPTDDGDDGDAGRDGACGPVRVRPYKRYSAASIARIAAAPHDDDDARIVAERPENLDFYPEYEAMYESFWRAHPELGAKIGIESRTALEEYAAHDGLRLIRIDGELAGVTAALRHAEFGLRGWRMRERVLSERHRGAGYGTRTLRAFVESLAHDPGDLVWGTIFAENVGSRRSAERLGRIDIGGLVWVTR